jgi:hypothetical protein
MWVYQFMWVYLSTHFTSPQATQFSKPLRSLSPPPSPPVQDEMSAAGGITGIARSLGQSAAPLLLGLLR